MYSIEDDYVTDAHHLNLFSTTLKNLTLRWFMEIGSNAITSQATIKEKFLHKY